MLNLVRVQNLVYRLIQQNPGITMVELNKRVRPILEKNFNIEVNSIDDVLFSLVKYGDVKTMPGCGPRGGKGYFCTDYPPLVEVFPKTAPSVWERLAVDN